MIVVNNKPCVIYCAGICLLPGANILSESQEYTLVADLAFPKLTSAKVLSVTQTKIAEENSGVSDPFFALSVQQAKKVAAEMLDRRHIMTLLEEEKRGPVVAVLQKQLDLLSKGDAQ